MEKCLFQIDRNHIAASSVMCEITNSFILWQLSHPYKFSSHGLEWQRRVEE